MNSRKVRVPATGVQVKLGPGTGDLINVSVSGALMRLDHEVEIGETWTLQLKPGDIELAARTVRCSTTSAPGLPPTVQRWLVAVTFAEGSSETARLIRELVAEMYQRTGASTV